jgi:hypothetical protein
MEPLLSDWPGLDQDTQWTLHDASDLAFLAVLAPPEASHAAHAAARWAGAQEARDGGAGPAGEAPAPQRALRCVDGNHAASCERCTVAPADEDAGLYCLRGEKGAAAHAR